MTSAVKVCSKCGESKGLGEFYGRKKACDGKFAYCKTCSAEANAEQYRRTKAKTLVRHKKRYYDLGIEGVKHNKRYSETRRKKHRFAVILENSRGAAKKFGHKPCNATEEELVTAFTGRCAMCKVLEADCPARLVMDHCHKSGNFRNFLCDRCNKILGFSGDNKEILLAAVRYLEDNEIKERI